MLDTKIQCAQDFHLVTPNDTDIIQQLMSESKRDKVHPIPGTIVEFIDFRVGTTNDTRQTWVRLDTAGNVKSALYSARFDRPLISPVDFCGDIAHILSTPSKHAGNSDPKSIIFYSISSFGRGEGETTISQVHEHFNDTRIYKTAPRLSTLSPLRAPPHPKNSAESTNFSNWLKKQHSNPHILKGDKEQLAQYAFAYLAENIHGVQRFHMGNGAEISDLNFNANAIGSADDIFGMNMMVNYGYGTIDTLEKNKELYAKGKLKIAAHLQQQAKRSCGRAHCFV